MSDLRAGVYLRVSTDRQDEANQQPACLQVCEARGWTPVVYQEREGATRVRPEWDRLLDDARRGEIRAVVFYSIHRIGRKRSQIASDLAALTRWGMAVVSVRERFLDVDNSPEMSRMRDMLIQWWGWFAQTEHEEIIDRTNRAIERVRKNLQLRGSHTSTKSGRTITRLGRPGFEPRWRDRALAIASAGGAHVTDPTGAATFVALRSPASIAAQLQREGAPKIHRSTVRDWLKRQTHERIER